MQNTLDKLSFEYDPVEDRLKLVAQWPGEGRVESARLLITRRVCSTWWADIAAMLELADAEPQSLYPAAVSVKKSVAPTPAEPPVSSSAAPAQTTPPTPDPSGSELVAKISCARRRKDGRWIIKFHKLTQGQHSLVLSDKALRQLADVLDRQIKAARWALPPPKAPRDAAPAKPTRSLH